MENISASNLKQLLEYLNKTNVDKQEIINYYRPISGNIYCLHNEIFKFYGDNVYKCGNSYDVDKRLNQYTTSYPKPSKIILLSEIFIDKNLAETILFYYLKEYKMELDREFFNCDINIIQDAFTNVKDFFIKYQSKEDIINYFLSENYNNFYQSKDTDKIRLLCLIKKNNLHEKIKEIIEIDNIDDDSTFNKIIAKKLLDLNKDEFNKIYQNNYNDFGSYSTYLDKIKTIFWLEEILNFERFKIDNIEIEDLVNIKHQLIINIDIIFLLFKNNSSKSKIIKSIKYKINSILNSNYLEKFIAECYNNLFTNLFIINKKRIRINSYKEYTKYEILYNNISNI